MISGSHSGWLRNRAAELGFSALGIARAEQLSEDARRLEQWLSRNMQGQMQYMANHFDLRIDPRLLVPGARSVITLMMNYYPADTLPDTGLKIARYAYGQDYHHVIRSKLRTLLSELQERVGAVEGRGFVDSAPVLERSWAVRSGLGWVGKNGNLIAKGAGSYFFLATLIVDLELDYDAPFATDHCGSCTRCLEACPTGAILPGKVVDGSRCISYYTIELKDAMAEVHQPWKEWIFGCDICQEVCPWNRFSTPHTEPAFDASPELRAMSRADWTEITAEVFQRVFARSALKRTGWENLRRNMRWVGAEEVGRLER